MTIFKKTMDQIKRLFSKKKPECTKIAVLYDSPEYMQRNNSINSKEDVYPFIHTRPLSAHIKEKNGVFYVSDSFSSVACFCSNCGHRIAENMVICDKCGSSVTEKMDLEQSIRFCSHCGQSIPPSSKFCPFCGRSTSLRTAEDMAPMNCVYASPRHKS